MTSPTRTLAACIASVDATPLADRNISFDEAMSISAIDPVADAMFARSRAYGDMLEASLKRTNEMLAPCDCGAATVFCNCETQNRLDMIARWGLPDDHFEIGPAR